MGKTLNMWKVAHLVATGEALSFNVTQIFQDLLEISLGGRVPGIPAPTGNMKISDTILAELYDATLKISDDLPGAVLDVAFANLGVGVSHKVIRFILDAVGARKSVTYMGYTLSWA